MPLTKEEVKKIAHLARLNVPEDLTSHYVEQLSRIMTFIEQMKHCDTSQIEPLAHPLDLSQRLRPDVVTEINLREKYQKIAPRVDASLYLVPKVIEEA